MAIDGQVVLEVRPEFIAGSIVQMHLAANDWEAWSTQWNAAFADAFVQE